MDILLKGKNLDSRVIDLIYEKQLQFKKEKKRLVSLEKTVERLLKEAYLSNNNEQVLPNVSLLGKDCG